MNCVCRLVLVVLSLWPERAAARGPPPGSARAEMDSTVLLTRSLLLDTQELFAQLKNQYPVAGGFGLKSLPKLAMSAGALGALQLSSMLTRLRTDLLSYLRHMQWLRRVGGPSVKSLEPELGTLQTQLDRLLRRLQLLMASLALPQVPPELPAPPLPSSLKDWRSIQAAHAIIGGLHLTLDWAVRGLMLQKAQL
ncbi:interleukin-11 isoform X1 [Fukomys damarensis]|uniref:interleukin-11 isoform X1 n=1 Tax=Fukomys damarensis TaxID=885580 RepID=UPI00053F42FE|nr:interleukin-11 isoform X1 [Fukomys damarensis]